MVQHLLKQPRMIWNGSQRHGQAGSGHPHLIVGRRGRSPARLEHQTRTEIANRPREKLGHLSSLVRMVNQGGNTKLTGLACLWSDHVSGSQDDQGNADVDVMFIASRPADAVPSGLAPMEAIGTAP